MCGNFFHPSSPSFLGNNHDNGLSNIALAAALTAVGAPELGALTGLGSAAATGLTGALVGGGLSGAEGGNPLVGAAEGGVGGYLGGGGLSDITNGIGLTTNGVSDLAPDLSNFSPTSGLSQLFGGTAAPSADLTADYNAINSAAPNLESSAGATSPNDYASGGSYGSGGSPVPGATSGPGAIAATAGGGGAGSIGGGAAATPGIGEAAGNTGSAISGNTGTYGFDLGGNTVNPSSVGLGAGESGTQQGGFLGALSNIGSPANTATGSFDINGAPTGAASISIPEQFQLAGSTGSTGGNMAASTMGSATNPLNGLINGGLSYLLNNSNQKGANQISNAAKAANANYQPYLQQGTAAENTLGNLYGNNGAEAQTTAEQGFQDTPGYQFALNQGVNAVNANAAEMGNPLSGNNEQAVNNYAQGTASQQYNNYVNQLQNMASGGMTAAGGIGSNLLTGAGAQAQVGQNQANAENTAVGTGLNALFPSGGINLQQLLSGGNSGGGGAGLLGMLGSY